MNSPIEKDTSHTFRLLRGTAAGGLSKEQLAQGRCHRNGALIKIARSPTRLRLGLRAVIMARMGDVTQLLEAMRSGDASAGEHLMSFVYEELRRIAAGKMAGEAAGHTLQPTALVHEAWLRLAGNRNMGFDNRAHFFSCAAEAMRRILIESARRKKSLKRGAGAERVELEAWHAIEGPPPDEALAVHEALDCLAAKDPVSAELVKLLYFAGLTMEEAATALNVSKRTAEGRWTYSRAWLRQVINEERTQAQK